MTRLLTGHVMHVPADPFAPTPAGAAPGGSTLEAVHDGALAVNDGRILEVGAAPELRRRYPDATLQPTEGWILPGLVDGHVHYPQLPVMGVLGLRLTAWLQQRTLPHEARFNDTSFARGEARTFLAALARHGTTTAMVFGAHQATAMAAFFEEASASRLRITSGLVLGDRELPPALRTDPARAVRESRSLIEAWHGRDRLRYAVTPRFSVAASEALLAACGELLSDREDLWFTTHLNETPEEIAFVRNAFPAARDYLDSYDLHGLIGPRSILAHDVHPTERELARLGESRAVVCHCPGSNQFIGSGLFPMRRHLAHGVRLMLGSDVGGGPGFGLLGEARTAYQTQMLQGDAGVSLGASHLLWLATAGGAAALGLADRTGDFAPGKAADLVVLRPPPHGTLAERLRHSTDAEDALSALVAMAGEADVACTMVAGETVWDARDKAHPGGG